MKKIICLLLSLFLMLTLLTSCELQEYITKIEGLIVDTVDKGHGTTTSNETETSTPEAEDSKKEPEETKPNGGTTTPEGAINYGTIFDPVSVTYAYSVCANYTLDEISAKEFRVIGTVTKIVEATRNAYFTDGRTELRIYFPVYVDFSDLQVGETILVNGHIMNYQGTIEMVGSGIIKQNVTPEDPTFLFTDFTSEEKALFADYFGFVIPFISNNKYFVEEYEFEDEVGINFYTYENTQAEFDAYRSLFSSYASEGSDVDDYGDTWYFYSKGDVYIDMSRYVDDHGVYVVDIYVYTVAGNNNGNEGDGEIDPDDSEINYGTLNSPVSTTYAHTVCANLANNESSANAFYVKGTVTKIGQTGSYYKNVYFTDGTTEMLIYTINMSDGITGFAVGDTIVAYGYIKNYNGTIEMATYNSSVYVYVVKVESSGGNQGGSQGGTSNHLYTDFTPAEKTLFNSSVGLVIPFLSNSEYYVEEYTFENETGINFYTYGNTASEFSAYRSLFSSYSYDGSEKDDYGDTWYYYSKGDICVDMSRYADDDGNYVIDIYVYTLDDSENNDWGDDWGDTDNDYNLITNEGKGLPQNSNGIYNVDFTKGEYVQNVTDQGYYIDGCPTTGSPAVLVIPVEFSDITAVSKGYTIANIERIFNGVDLPYYSVHDYFFISSYEQLDLEITVLDSWFCPKNSSSYYEKATYNYYGQQIFIGDQLILDEALAYLATIMDLSKFDSDSNGMIDAVVMVNTLEIGDDDFHWAYRYWNLYTNDDGYYYEYDNVSANDYVWLAYEFMFEGYDEEGNGNYNTSNPLNTYAFIHEFSHILGIDDYYDTEGNVHPMNGCDVMDDMLGDHNPYTKFNLGWITSSKLVVTNGTLTLNLSAFAKNGDTVLLANNWDENLGAYQEYYVIIYYTMTNLNAGDAGYFARDGIVVYHINASLFVDEVDGEIYYNIYNTNSSGGDLGTENNLIEFVKSGNDTYTYVVGDTLPSVTDDYGDELGYTFQIDALTDDYATITFSKK